jgi:hypothetical protein
MKSEAFKMQSSKNSQPDCNQKLGTTAKSREFTDSLTKFEQANPKASHL